MLTPSVANLVQIAGILRRRLSAIITERAIGDEETTTNR
jgi:hypothetical protein